MSILDGKNCEVISEFLKRAAPGSDDSYREEKKEEVIDILKICCSCRKMVRKVKSSWTVLILTLSLCVKALSSHQDQGRDRAVVLPPGHQTQCALLSMSFGKRFEAVPAGSCARAHMVAMHRVMQNITCEAGIRRQRYLQTSRYTVIDR